MSDSAIPQFHNSTIPKGDFSTRSNEVESVFRRVSPHDWDGGWTSVYARDYKLYTPAKLREIIAASGAHVWARRPERTCGRLSRAWCSPTSASSPYTQRRREAWGHDHKAGHPLPMG